jgi:hypothetical protein
MQSLLNHIYLMMYTSFLYIIYIAPHSRVSFNYFQKRKECKRNVFAFLLMTIGLNLTYCYVHRAKAEERLHSCNEFFQMNFRMISFGY